MNNKPQSELERLKDDYEIYLSCADDGKGGDTTRNGVPLLAFEQWCDEPWPCPGG
jgi:hypothetical protein